ncbi:RNA methyltransferase [Truepera radiovictrix]|uniref:RNA methyltransferase n=1 Tax=Truepera radiovictrix TaxID=332249 RepID=UPI000316181A|nr:RNA methyltransferase [Truepera radiovictrix]WMT57438.1 RNA methyltransferase [Truepera radiovictrix]
MGALRIVLVRPKDPANVGAAARAMKNFGLGDLHLVAPQRPIGRRAYALASHAQDVLQRAVEHESVAEALKGCTLVLGTTARERREGRMYTPREAAQTLTPEGLAVLFGPEDFGLSNDDLKHCQGYIRIPTAAYASLNLAQAVQLVAYEWFVTSQEQPPPSPPEERAARELLEGMYDHLLKTLHLIGYTDAQRQGSAERLFRAIFDRADLSAREVAALRGLWRQVAWAVTRGSAREQGS